ncbi:hypothetical protein HDZ31DRAFT_49051 [Schizophyllum fasciatum]
MQASFNPRNSYQLLCEQCHERPQFNDGVERYQYCGRSCAIKARTAATQTPSVANSPIQPICELSGCDRPVYVSPDGTEGKFCSRAHVRAAQILAGASPAGSQADGSVTVPAAHHASHGHNKRNSCLTCHYGTAAPGHVFCGTRCEQKAGEHGMVLADVPKDHVAFHDGKRSLHSRWMGADQTYSQARFRRVVGR